MLACLQYTVELRCGNDVTCNKSACRLITYSTTYLVPLSYSIDVDYVKNSCDSKSCNPLIQTLYDPLMKCFVDSHYNLKYEPDKLIYINC